MKLSKLFLLLTFIAASVNLFSQNYVVFSTNNDRFWEINVDKPFVYTSISEQLDAIAPYSGYENVPITISHNGQWFAFLSTRFDNENGDWPCLVIVATDYLNYEVIKDSGGNLIHSVGRAMVTDNGNSIIFVSEDLGNHFTDVFIIHRNGSAWDTPLNLTKNSTYNYNYFPTVSRDGKKVLFDASISPYPSEAIGEVNIDGTNIHFPIVAAAGEEAHSGSYDAAGNIIYEGSNDESIWKLVAGTNKPVRLAPNETNDNTPFVLPDGRIVSLKLPDETHQMKIMNADGTNNHMITDSSSFFREIADVGLSGYSAKSTSVKDIAHYSGLAISPNPATDYIDISTSTVMLNEVKHPVIKIYDVLGVCVLTLPCHSCESRNLGIWEEIPNQVGNDSILLRIDVSELSPGVYFVHLGDKVMKFVKI